MRGMLSSSFILLLGSVWTFAEDAGADSTPMHDSGLLPPPPPQSASALQQGVNSQQGSAARDAYMLSDDQGLERLLSSVSDPSSGQPYAQLFDDELLQRIKQLVQQEQKRLAWDRRSYAPMFVGKKSAPMFVGKKSAPMFLGRRAAPYFVGKKSCPNVCRQKVCPDVCGKEISTNVSWEESCSILCWQKSCSILRGQKSCSLLCGQKGRTNVCGEEISTDVYWKEIGTNVCGQKVCSYVHRETPFSGYSQQHDRFQYARTVYRPTSKVFRPSSANLASALIQRNVDLQNIEGPPAGAGNSQWDFQDTGPRDPRLLAAPQAFDFLRKPEGNIPLSKKYAEFIGKRVLDKRFSEFLGKREVSELMRQSMDSRLSALMAKRLRNFIPEFVGKRARNQPSGFYEFIGK